MATEKVGSTGRYGSRYGVGIRKRLLKVEPHQRGRKICPQCGSKSIVRTSKGIFNCKKCKLRFVGGAYTAKTLAGSIVGQMVALKSFAPALVETLQKAKEGEVEAPSVPANTQAESDKGVEQ